MDDGGDRSFYATPRLVTHIDEPAIAAVGLVYEQLGLDGRVLDLMSSWISHFKSAPAQLVALGMNQRELAANVMASGAVVADLNRSPQLPFPDDSFDGAVCCVSVDYLTQPLEVFDEVGRVVRAGGTFCCTFSNRCFPTKAIAGWLAGDDRSHLDLVVRYFALSDRWTEATATAAIPPGGRSDPLYAVWAEVA
jgi:SAM-dependent methyltransferase